jgi:uncharacterized protein (TIGR03435 family)
VRTPLKLWAALPFALSLACPAALVAQAAAAPPRFDVASVKLNAAQSSFWLRLQRSGGRIQWTTQLEYLIEYAFNLQPWRIAGEVSGAGRIYDIDATTDPSASVEQLRLMFRSLLIDRFRMATHFVTRDVDGYALSVAKGGPKMETALEHTTPPLPAWFAAHASDPAPMEGHIVSTAPAAGVGNLVGRRVSMHDLCESLQRIVGTAVFDQTALAGSYYFAFQYAAADAPVDVTLPNLFAAVKDLGLKLEKQRGPVEMLVVDHIERTPTEN